MRTGRESRRIPRPEWSGPVRDKCPVPPLPRRVGARTSPRRSTPGGGRGAGLWGSIGSYLVGVRRAIRVSGRPPPVCPNRDPRSPLTVARRRMALFHAKRSASRELRFYDDRTTSWSPTPCLSGLSCTRVVRRGVCVWVHGVRVSTRLVFSSKFLSVGFFR